MASKSEQYVRGTLTRSLSRLEQVWKNEVFNEEYAAQFLGRLANIYSNDRHTDVALKVGQEKIKSHRVVLMAFSHYFEKLFTENVKEGDQSELELKDISAEPFKTLLGYAYTGKIEIRADNVESLLETASILGVEYVLEECGKSLYPHLTTDMCLAVYRVAKLYNIQSIIQGTRFYIVSHFTQVVDEEDFLEIDEEELKEFLKDDNLMVLLDGIIPTARKQEEIIVDAVLKWVEHIAHKEDREKSLASVLEHVRLNQLSDSVILALDEKLASVDASLSCKSITQSETTRAKQNKCLRTNSYQKYAVSNALDHHRVKEFMSCAEIGSLSHITGMDIYIRLWDSKRVLGGVKFHYSDGIKELVGGEDGMEKESFTLSENERITSVKVASGWLIDRITFYTNQGNQYGPYGGDGGEEHPVENPSEGSYGALVGMKGWVIEDHHALCLTDMTFLWLEHSSEDPTEAQEQTKSSCSIM